MKEQVSLYGSAGYDRDDTGQYSGRHTSPPHGYTGTVLGSTLNQKETDMLKNRMKMIPQRFNSQNYISFTLILVFLAAFVAAFFYFDKRYDLSASILQLGILGNVIAVIVMALLYMTPIPSEGLLVMCFKIYGVYLGVFLSWLGMDISTIATFVIARVYGQKLIQKAVSPKQFATVDNWIKRKGTLGLLIARFLPVPAFAINCIAGMMPSVEFWPYLWTAAVSIVPYYIGTALVFLGIYNGTWPWLLFGIGAIAVFSGASYVLNRRQT